ncbi:MAG: flagellar biosynthetic protein FliO [Burkholderiaceae bacterium]
MTTTPYAIWTSLLLISVVVLIPILYLARKRLGGWPGQGPKNMAILETLAVGPRERLMVVSVAGQTLLLGVTAQQIQLLRAMEPGPAAEAAADSFATRLDGALTGTGKD